MLRTLIRSSGLAPRRIRNLLPDWLRYQRDRKCFSALDHSNIIPWGEELPMLGEWRDASGDPGAYFFQDRLVAQWIFKNTPRRHVDVGSRIDGFIGHLSVFRDVDVLDIRPLPIKIPNVSFHQLDLTQPLADRWFESTDSLSCLHTIEHFGLGRYGDSLDPDGHLKGLSQLARILMPGGRFYLSTPVGRERVNFNAHRVFSPATMLSWFDHGWSVEQSAVIDDENQIRESTGADALSNATCDTGVGIVCARKLPS